MPKGDIIGKIKRYVLNRETDDGFSLKDIINDISDTQAINTLVEATKDFPLQILGNDVFLQIKEKLQKEDGFFNAMLLKIKDTRINDTFRHLALDFLDSASRKKSDRTLYDETLISLISTQNETEQLKARALRYLSRSSDQRVESVMDKALASDSIVLLDAACHLLNSRLKEGKSLIEKRASLLADKALSNMNNIFEMPGLLSTLANSKNAIIQNALEKIVQMKMTTFQRTQFISAAGKGLSDDAFARIVQSCEEEPSYKTQWAIHSILAEQSNRMNLLYDKGYYRQYIFLYSIALNIEDKDSVQRILNLAKSKDPEIASLALQIVISIRREAEFSKNLKEIILIIDKEMPLEDLHNALNQNPKSELQKKAELYVQKHIKSKLKEEFDTQSMPSPIPHNWPQKTAAAFSSGLNLADALYRNLMTHVGNNEHWHTGIFLGFSPTIIGTGNGKFVQGEMLGIHASNAALYWGDTIVHFSAVKNLNDADIDVADTMRELTNNFIFAFKENSEEVVYHGTRYSAYLTYEQRVNIASTASNFYSKGILYTFADMLDYKGRNWSGNIDDIEDSRCDGVVEYSYEKNGVMVCGGKDSRRWNIASPGKEHIDNHEDFHNHSYNHGELCPRIQAGNQSSDSDHRGANDSTFIVGQSEPPVIEEFDIKWVYPFVPSISFRVTSRSCSKVFIRIIVSKDGQPYDFVRTDDPYGNNLSESGDWMFKEVAVNNWTAAKISGWWTGKTARGYSFKLNGNFDFRIVAVDTGGNVSAEVSKLVRLSPESQIFDKIPFVEKVCILKAPVGQTPVNFCKFSDSQSAGVIKYSARWEEYSTQTSVYRKLIIEKNDLLLCKKGLAYVFIQFGPCINSNSNVIMKDDSVRLVLKGTYPNGSNIEIPVEVKLGDEALMYYWGTFLPVNSWQNNYRLTLEINGTSLKSSYKLNSSDGDPLDAHPESIPRLVANPLDPLEFQIYGCEPGADRKHNIEIGFNKLPSPDRFEVNDTIEQAAEIDLTANKTWNGRLSLHNSNDVDFFHITFPSQQAQVAKGIKTKYFVVEYNESHLKVDIEPDDCEQSFSLSTFDSDRTKKNDYSRVTSVDILSPHNTFKNSNIYLSLKSDEGDTMEYNLTLKYMSSSWSCHTGKPWTQIEKPLEWLNWPINEYLSRVNPVDIFEDLVHRLDAGRPVTIKQKLQEAEIKFSLGQFAATLGKYIKAESLYKESLDIVIKNKGTKVMIKNIVRQLVYVYKIQGKRIEASRILKQYLRLPRI